MLKVLKLWAFSTLRPSLDKTHRRAGMDGGMNINIQVISLGKSWAIKHFRNNLEHLENLFGELLTSWQREIMIFGCILQNIKNHNTHIK